MKKDNLLKQTARWVARMFGYKAENKYARIVWHFFITSVTVIVLIIASVLVYHAVDEVGDMCQNRRMRRMNNEVTYLHDYLNEYVSPYVIYHDGYPSYLYNTLEGRRTLTDITWICKSSDRDSLAVFCTGNKRGYFNRFNGQLAIPAQYEKAWVFSDGVACVMEKGMLKFIDHKGNAVIDKVFPYTPLIGDYCFYNGLCLMENDCERWGLIDRNGNWKVQPEYRYINRDEKGNWLVEDVEHHYGLLDANGQIFLECIYDYISLPYDAKHYCVRTQDHVDVLVDFEGNVINSCDFNNVDLLDYNTEEYDEYGAYVTGFANCMSYRSSDWHYGLMDKKGNMVTLPLYSVIRAIGPDRYYCEGPKGAVILDGKGKKCGEKL